MSDAPVALVAMADNGVIGRDNGLPWHLPDDLKRFKAITIGHSVLMGRQDLRIDRQGAARPAQPRADPQSRLERPRLRGGDLTRRGRAQSPASSTLFVIGGAEVFSLCWPIIGRLELTEVHGDVEGDTRLAGIRRAEWREIFREAHAADARHAWPFSFVTLVRRPAAP